MVVTHLPTSEPAIVTRHQQRVLLWWVPAEPWQVTNLLTRLHCPVLHTRLSILQCDWLTRFCFVLWLDDKIEILALIGWYLTSWPTAQDMISCSWTWDESLARLANSPGLVGHQAILHCDWSIFVCLLIGWYLCTCLSCSRLTIGLSKFLVSQIWIWLSPCPAILWSLLGSTVTPLVALLREVATVLPLSLVSWSLTYLPFIPAASTVLLTSQVKLQQLSVNPNSTTETFKIYVFFAIN